MPTSPSRWHCGVSYSFILTHVTQGRSRSFLTAIVTLNLPNCQVLYVAMVTHSVIMVAGPQLTCVSYPKQTFYKDLLRQIHHLVPYLLLDSIHDAGFQSRNLRSSVALLYPIVLSN